jgi:hypothetical protein
MVPPHEWRGAIEARENERAASVVEFWRTLEMFSPQRVPSASPPGPSTKPATVVLDLEAGHPAPWSKEHPLSAIRLRDKTTWQFTVYGGLYATAKVRSELTRAFGQDNVPADARADEQTAVFACILDEDGALVENSPVLSSCAWAVSRLRSPGLEDPSWLDGFALEESAFRSGLNRLAPNRKSERPAPLETVGAAVAAHVRGAARDAAAEGARTTGTAVKAVVATGVSSVAGPIVGGIAASVAGKFAEKLLTPLSDGKPADDGSPPENARGPRIHMTPDTLLAFTAELVKELGLDEALEAGGVRVKCTPVSISTAEATSEQNFLNSYLADDLAQVEEVVRAGSHGAALATYLTDERSIPVSGRIDVRTRRDAQLTGVEPHLIPGARWPSAPDRPLVVSQQFAVDRAMLELADSEGLFAVNGPPGTGKTTMLRDLLAGIVLGRARKLAELRNPLDAYAEVTETVELSKRYHPGVRSLIPELTGFEMVVATSGNKAAANVTREIPGVGAVAGAEAEAVAADYFPELASHLLGQPAWGLAAATLGNMSLRKDFADKFWWSGQESDDEPAGMQRILKEAEPLSPEEWRAAAAAFRKVDEEVRDLGRIRQAVATDITEYARCLRLVRDAEQRVRKSHEHRARLAETLRQVIAARDRAAQLARGLEQAVESWRAQKPGFWASLCSMFRLGSEWREGHRTLSGQHFAALQEFNAHLFEATNLAAAIEAAEADARHLEAGLAQARSVLASIDARIKAARAQWPGTVPAGPEFEGEEEFQRCPPWADAEFTSARNRLFFAALALHKSFLFAAIQPARDNLAVLTKALQGKQKLLPETTLAAWQSLFLVVPVVSTTFASLPRLFSDLGTKALGWLFVDEAGQATAQQVAGGLWRCRRAVIVGDPQQLEPIVTVPLPAQHALRNRLGVHEQWLPESTSAQGVADRHARHGTALPGPDGEGQIWVGAPLRVHRRCDRPMFQVSNDIAYGGDLMIYGTPERGDYPGASSWLDVRSESSRDNWIPAEGEALVRLLAELSTQGVPLNSIRVISPFRDVVRECPRMINDFFGSGIFPSANVGTVHTVQGQESDVVVLVLGSAPHKPGARAWAASKPNLLNVAASRAKRRLYVIGNRERWEHLRYFSRLAATLPVQAEPQS